MPITIGLAEILAALKARQRAQHRDRLGS